MPNYNKATLITFFQQNDVPQGTDFANLINSQVNLVETAEQDMAGPLSTTQLITPQISAANVNVTNVLSAIAINCNGNMAIMNISANQGFFNSDVTVSGNIIVRQNISANSINIITDVSATSGSVYASAGRFNSGVYQGVGIVSAAGTTQATGAALTNIINRCQGVNDGSATGFAIIANRAGLTQYLVNETAVSGNLWPPTGGTINGNAANAVFVLAAHTSYTIFHVGASAYGVK